MRNLILRAILSCMLMLVLPASMFAADSSAAMLYTNGTAWINSGNVPKSSAIFSGDLVQTKADSVASIKAPGTSVLVSSDSMGQFQGTSIKLEHGGLNVGTSKSMAPQSVASTWCPHPRPGPSSKSATLTGPSRSSPTKGISR